MKASHNTAKEFKDFWYGKKVFLTGHTGFKGSWLYYWLIELGAVVQGYSLQNTVDKVLSDALGIPEDNNGNINHLPELSKAINNFSPDIVLHLAAQSLVNQSLENPIETFQTNIMGTANLLEGMRGVHSIKSSVVITSDKCYQANQLGVPLLESDHFGGDDPYSASKGAAELIVHSYKHSFFNAATSPLISTARAGNVIGGGDFSNNRIVPDIIRSVISRNALTVRNPLHVRPWQHVLDPLYGYLLMAQLQFEGLKISSGYNFGPAANEKKTVLELIEEFKIHFPDINFTHEKCKIEQPTLESPSLSLNSSLAAKELGWSNKLSFKESVEFTSNWYHAYLQNKSLQFITTEQINDYMNKI